MDVVTGERHDTIAAVIECRDGVDDIVAWTAANKARIEELLLAQGAVLFRGFPFDDIQLEFEAFSREIGGELVEYETGSTPRTALGGSVYTSTEYPPYVTIAQHNEQAYGRDWPMKLMFCCLQPASEGGETPLASSVAVTSRISERTREKFRAKEVLYVRNYWNHIDLSWSKAFHTTDRSAVEQACRAAGIEWEWMAGDALRTRQRSQALATHPVTGDEIWFNQAHTYHISVLDADVRDALLKLFAEPDLPRNAYYGDGSPIEREVLAEIRDAYAAEMRSFRWLAGDVLLIDNMLVSHGRMPYKGQREVIVAMAEPFSRRHARVPR